MNMQNSPPKPALVVVFDSGGARFFRQGEGGALVLRGEMKSGLTHFSHDSGSDAPGRGFGSAGGGVRHAYEPKHDKHKLEKHDFVHQIAADIDSAYERHEFTDLVLVAPARSLGEFRTLASDKLKALGWREVSKEFSAFSAHEIEQRLEAHFAAKPFVQD